ncbi:restriction endonuclease subunit S [Methylomonas koyamae]|uniref:restriction endonuclease subunit S n=1 Tax=Methylomonas koyamae TaxID=702114 RepID=UPI00164293AF|nr:restriction endonuclease subunit S [Methylomonas koyamae]
MNNQWTELSLDKVCKKITDGEHTSPKTTPSGVPLISAKDVREWGVDFSDTKFVPTEFSAISRRRCNPEIGDVLVVSRGATVGRACFIRTDTEFCLMGSVLLFKPDYQFVSPNYLATFLQSPLGIDKLTTASGASAQSAIYIRDTKKLMISVPPKDEQTEIVRRVESLFAYADRLESRYNAARAQVEKLTPALLAKAFRGELVPQDPNDEPANELLARIAASKSAEQPKARAGKRQRKPA